MNANGFSSQGGRGKNKRFWKKEEEEALIDCSLELSCDQQWKGGGFKNGYLNKLELMLNTKFPGCDIKAIPHIESKFKWFKDKYPIVSEMVNKTSGFQLDEKTSTIQCERQAYDDFCKDKTDLG
ncbi:Patatin-like phospholipase domain-containing protein 5 [Bienertia sinuspersici]